MDTGQAMPSYHKALFLPAEVRAAILKESGKMKLSFDLVEKETERGEPVGTLGFIMNKDNGNIVLFHSDRLSTSYLPIRYTYAFSKADFTGGTPRYGDDLASVSKFICEMLRESPAKAQQELKIWHEYRDQKEKREAIA